MGTRFEEHSRAWPYARLQILTGHLRSDLEGTAGNGCAPSHCSASSAPCSFSKVVSAEEAVAEIEDGARITVGGFVGSGCPEAVLLALRQHFVYKGHPKGLRLLQVCVTGDGKGRGMDLLAAEGLLSEFIFGWTGNCPALIKLIKEHKVQAWNLPLGMVSHMIRDAAAGRPGPMSRIGAGTFVDPREGGGKLNSMSQADVVGLIMLDGTEYLHYRAPKIDVAILRGTTADMDGNVAFEKECFFADNLNQAIAAHANGGVVIVQVERIVAAGLLPMRKVHLPAALVDKVVVAPAEHHRQRLAFPDYDGSLSGEVRTPASLLQPLGLDVRKVIAHRCMLEFDTPNAIVNLGVGMPEGVASLVSSHAERDCPDALPITLSTEVGMIGGIPCGGNSFGAAANADSLMPTSTMIDLIHGRGLDATVLGCAEVDEAGNVNVSRFSGRHPGCGGFIDISQSAKRVVFAGTFTSGGLQVEVADGKLRIIREGKLCKFRRKVQEKTFAGISCSGRRVLYVTERCVFRLIEAGRDTKLELTEIAPGARLQEDVLALMEFAPIVNDVKVMDARCFRP